MWHMPTAVWVTPHALNQQTSVFALWSRHIRLVVPPCRGLADGGVVRLPQRCNGQQAALLARTRASVCILALLVCGEAPLDPEHIHDCSGCVPLEGETHRMQLVSGTRAPPSFVTWFRPKSRKRSTSHARKASKNSATVSPAAAT